MGRKRKETELGSRKEAKMGPSPVAPSYNFAVWETVVGSSTGKKKKGVQFLKRGEEGSSSNACFFEF